MQEADNCRFPRVAAMRGDPGNLELEAIRKTTTQKGIDPL